MQKDESLNFLRELDNLKAGRYHYFIDILSDMGYFLDGYDLLVIGPALIFIAPLFHIGAVISSIIGVATIVGQLIGGAVFGFIADMKGRKVIYQWDMLIFAVFAILSAVSQNYIELIAFRSLLGLAIGADYALTLSIIGEFSPVKHRGKYLGTGLMSWWIGGSVAVALGLLFLPLGSIAWRWLLGAGAVPAIIVLILRRRVDETPRYAVEKNEKNEIKDIKEKFKIKDENDLNNLKNASYATGNVNYTRRGIFTFTSWFLNDLIFYGIGIYTVTLLLELGYSTHAGSLALTLILYVIGVIGTLVFVFTADIIGRKKWQEYTFLAQGVSLFILALYFLAVRSAPPILLLFPMFAIFYFANAGGTGETTGIFVSELFPTRMRTTAMGAGTAISRVGAIISAVVFPITLKLYGIVPMELLLFIVGLAGFLITLFLGEETKDKSLEQIAA
ncbi:MULTISPECIES: MFS transporter [Acidiplasma]|jgi:putative MFS transporter|uniref:Transporter n=3 Tax=Acidiplasma TaxID=507753 RepID=A0A0Q0WF68_9ARCH|nr:MULTISPECIES: MFS transporter [Acidiplasma]KJE48608.1 transporter [Acidiplasma sp. MBA-1]KQB33465.1 transporter [Acidiplasma aeolicum]KQB34023.1 transporter [Acidiplasma cupricumulans]WMT55351.1 MAG: MFS transporter [Acidiplasma sp.]